VAFRRSRLPVLVIAVLMTLVSPAAANRFTELVSTGPVPSTANGAGAGLGAATPDGSLVVFETAKALVASDHDSCTDPDFPDFPFPCSDVYARNLRAGTTDLVSTGPQDQDGPYQAFFEGASENVGRVAFTTDAPLVSADTHDGNDIYVRDLTSGTTQLVSTGPSAPGGAFAGFNGMSQDGSRIAFSTFAALVPEDTDTGRDVYVRDLNAGTTQLVSTGPLDHGSVYPYADIPFAGMSPDGNRVFFATHDQFVSDDTDGEFDLYARDVSRGTTELVSKGPNKPGGGGATQLDFLASSFDGSRALFSTDTALVAEDNDECNPFPARRGCGDIYERDLDSGTTTLVSVGTQSASGFYPANASDGQGGASADLNRVVWETAEPLVPEDTDGTFDLYWRDLRSNTTQFVSRGPSAPGGGRGKFGAISQDGSKVFFDGGKLVPEDQNTAGDVYEYDTNTQTTTLVSTGSQGATQGFSSIIPVTAFRRNGFVLAHHGGISADGSDVFFESTLALAPSDTNGDFDLYERDLATPTPNQLSIGPTGQSGEPDFGFQGNTPSGSHVFFVTYKQLVPEDMNQAPDLYASIRNGAPVCADARATPGSLLPANKSLRRIAFGGLTDPDGDTVEVTVDSVTQDEPVAGKNDKTSPDAVLVPGAGQVRLRAERNPHGDGRVYRIAYTASDGHGGSCSGTLTVGVPRHNGEQAVDSAPPAYDSTG
jgi:hypothetical protein